jgi:hypothetical protein
LNIRDEWISAATGFSVPWGRIAFPVTGWTGGTDRALEYPGLSEPDLPVLLLMNPEKRPLILGDFKIPPSFLYTYESCSLKFKFGL